MKFACCDRCGLLVERSEGAPGVHVEGAHHPARLSLKWLWGWPSAITGGGFEGPGTGGATTWLTQRQRSAGFSGSSRAGDAWPQPRPGSRRRSVVRDLVAGISPGTHPRRQVKPAARSVKLSMAASVSKNHQSLLALIAHRREYLPLTPPGQPFVVETAELPITFQMCLSRRPARYAQRCAPAFVHKHAR